jgi:hypothetical protein
MKRLLLGLSALLVAISMVAQARAAIIITNPANITLANSQVEVGGDTTDNPNVVNGMTGPLLSYTPSHSNGVCCGATYGLSPNLTDGDVGIGNLSDGTYALPNSNGLLTLNFGSTQLIDSIAIYNGYGNRDDGTYTLLDDMNNVLGAYTISGTGGATNAGVDSFWLTFNSPVSTSELRLQLGNIENSGSFREIQVFEAQVPEPASLALWGVLGGAAMLVVALRRRRTS